MNAPKWWKIVPTLLVACAVGVAYAKLPPAPPVDPAKAEEAKKKAAEGAKKDGELLAKSQDRVADRYIKAQKAKGVTVKPTPIVVAAAPASKPTASAPAAATPAQKK